MIAVVSYLGWSRHPPSELLDEARILAGSRSAAVAQGLSSDCEALASFADAWAEWAGDAPRPFLAGFNVFIPRGKANYPLGAFFALTGVPNAVKLEGATSGYRPRFRKHYEPNRPEGSPHDQAHHFAPYLILGAAIPADVARAFLKAAERPESWGDIELGKKAIEYGSQLGSGALSPEQTAERIRTELCLPPLRGS